ncbi:hypothetical protein F7D01_12890 [Erythrobacter sp. 3-20A1M]|jgi:hypothetical protein|uniref:hypothetical protein n=1 Tax=Erythrobacter sp. 3-20A1M TaxID=2653850 RepID=UPI001BFC9E7A|nr:hypothetical protein [Erythrobacter sp. 3-20A1M]MCV0383760.1 hypothetical protein [Erythrobacter sp.]QWC57846.1 hypothetical protein F7D01_12890 [Erythrobacter sp. 3-20A1M]
MIRVVLLLPVAALIAACSPSGPEQLLCTFDDKGRIVTQSGNAEAACVEPAPIPTGATQEQSGRLTILEAPLPPPFSDLGEKLPPDPVNSKPVLERFAVPPELSYYIRAFPQAAEPRGAVLDLGSQHTIVLRDGCFFLDREGADDPLVFFPYSTALVMDEEGYLAFGSRYEPNRMGSVRVGLTAETGWFGEPSEPDPALAEACGNHKVVSVTTVSNPFNPPDRFTSALRRYGERSGATEKQIVERANKCAVEQAKREADRRLRNPALDPIDCNRFWGF